MISISIVLHNTPEEQINNVLYSVLNSTDINIIYIIDNSSTDIRRTLKCLSPKIKYIHTDNRGYGAGHNIAIKAAIDDDSKYHVILNPDIRFASDVLGKITDFMDKNEDVGYILPKVIYPNGEIQYLCKLLPTPVDVFLRRFLPNIKWSKKRNDRYILKSSGYDKIINPPCLSGCFMFLRVETLRKYNLLFDERFFMYFEDFDLMRRIHRVAKTIFWPEVTIIHDHQKSSYKNKKMLLIHIMSAIKYFNKYGWFFDKERHLMNKKILKEISELS